MQICRAFLQTDAAQFLETRAMPFAWMTSLAEKDPQENRALAKCLVEMGDWLWERGKTEEARQLYHQALCCARA